MDANHIFEALIILLLGTGVKSLNDMKRSVIELNNKVAVILNDLGHHKSEIDRLDGRVERLERSH